MKRLVQFATLMVSTWGVGITSSYAQSSSWSYPIGSMVAYPILEFATGYSSNITEGDNKDEGSWFVSAGAGGGVQGKNRGHLYGLEYEATGIWYADSGDDNALDHRLTGYGGTAFNVRNHIDGGIELLRGHDGRHQDFVWDEARYSVDADEPDEWDQAQAGVNYTFGAPNAKGRIEVDVCGTCRQYTNNGQDFRDNNIIDVGLTFAGQVQPKTYLLIGAVYSDFDYTNENSADVSEGLSLDSNETRYFGGVDWEVTPKTTLHAKAGLLEKNFDDNKERSDYSEPYWEIDAEWAPRGRTNVTLGYSRGLYESVPWITGDDTVEDPDRDPRVYDDYSQSQEISVDWSEQWSPRILSWVSGGYGWDDWAPSDREDTRWRVTGEVDYVFNKWVSVGVGAFYSTRDSNYDTHDYEDSGFMLNLSIGQALGWSKKAPDICALR